MNDTSQPGPPSAAREPAASGSTSQHAPASWSAWRASAPALVIAAIALALAAGQWYDARSQIAALREDVAKRLVEADTQTTESRLVAEQVREAMAAAQVKLGVLESRLTESQDQQRALEALYQELSRNRDEWAYAEIEQSLFVANHQLQIAGNVKAALVALQAADARLRRLDRPQLTALRKAINRDIERLKVLPHVDIVAISAQLDGLIDQVDSLPLAVDARRQPERPPAPTAEPEGSLWARFWREAWVELKQLVRVQQLDKPDVALLAPSHAFFLRENLKLRLIGARLALLARDATSYKADLKAARDWLGRYYDTRHNGVAHALGVLRSLREAEVGIEPPEIGATLEAMRNVRIARDRGGR